ncbi:MAG: HAD family hydrolase [Clostridium fessum]
MFRTQYKDHDLLKAELYAGIKDLIRALRTQGCKIGVATLKREDYALTLLEHYHFTELRDSICGSDFASKMTKADVLHKCLKALELSPSEAVLIGDTSSDGKVPKSASCRFCGSLPTASDQIPRRHGVEYARLYGKGYALMIGAFLGVNF